MHLTIDQLVQSVVALFQHQPDLLLRFKEFLPEVREVMDDLVPPESFSEQCEESARRKTLKARPQATLLATISAASSPDQGGVEVPTISTSNDDDENVAANFLNLIKLYPSISIVLRHHLSLLQQFQTFLPTAPSDSELKEARAISESPPDELLVSPEFVEARRFIQAVKHESKCEMSMYDRFIQALEKYQNMGWNIDQVGGKGDSFGARQYLLQSDSLIYAEVSLIFWNNPDLVDGFKKFISILQ
ncbi:hypothetical protein BGW38_008818 [Lunasporangiospora selenospora]|uniref:Uncharacterized protein n=1 Tax=Lunasporangiospora selenospora TaxID=979761 RepID=A0A9P6KFJ3_9FUNG|nr:hypothetical protein BGW38_008818 [Lunasporangiospora selenospora]